MDALSGPTKYADDKIVRVGKKKDLTVPDGWRIVKSGLVINGDMFANAQLISWDSVEYCDIGEEIENYDFIIRRS